MRLSEVGPDIFGSVLPDAIQIVARRYQPANELQLEGILRKREGFDTGRAGAYDYAPVVERGTPVLWPVMAFTAGTEGSDLRIRVALFHQSSSSASSVEAAEERESSRHQAVAWRFEPPEGVSGSHCYYHAQPISSWNKDESGRLPVAVPLNESHPAFPLMAQDSVGLLAAVLVTLYGHEWTKNFLADRALRRDVDLVQDSFKGLNLLDSTSSSL